MPLYNEPNAVVKSDSEPPNGGTCARGRKGARGLKLTPARPPGYTKYRIICMDRVRPCTTHTLVIACC